MPSITKRAKAYSRNATPIPTMKAPTTRVGAESVSTRQPVIAQGTRPATTPGATRRKRALPAAAFALRTRIGRLTGERADQLREALGPVFGHERVGVLDPLELRAGNRVRQPL